MLLGDKRQSNEGLGITGMLQNVLSERSRRRKSCNIYRNGGKTWRCTTLTRELHYNARFFFFEIAILFSDIHVHVYALKEIESFRENQIFLNNITCATVV